MELQKLLTPKLVDQLAAFECRKSLYFFVKEFWDVIVPNEYIDNWHIQALCNEIQAADERVFKRLPRIADLVINIPPGTSKTLIVSILSTCWEFAKMPTIRVAVGSYSDTAVTSISDKIRLVMRSERYRRYFPHVKVRGDRDNIHNFKTESNGEFYAFTVGGTLTSMHFDILKIDDPINPKECTETGLKAAEKFFRETLPTRKVDKEVTVTYLVMQRLNEKDPTGYLLKNHPEEIHHICLPGLLSKRVTPARYADFYIDGLLDIHRLKLKDIVSLRKRLGEYGFGGQIQQGPAPEGGGIWKKWFIEVPDHAFPDISTGMAVGTDWDLAYTKKDSNAASAYITSFEIGPRIYIDDFGWDWLEFPELIRWMKTKKPAHYIENKASGISAKQTLIKNGIIAIEVPVKGGEDKIARARLASPVAESGLVYIRKSMADRLYNDDQQGILYFPNGQYKDLADALAQCLQRHTQGGFITHSQDETTEEERDLLSEL